jgi:2-aminobenzoate-CoA ligase
MLRSGHVDHFARNHLPAKKLQPTLLPSIDTQYPARLNAATALVDGPLKCGWGSQVCLINDQARCTYEQLAAQINRIAHVLINDFKLVPGNRVLLRGANTPMMAACWLAVVKAGLVAVATMPLLRAKELSQVIDKANVQLALCDFKLADEMHLAKTASPTLRQITFFSAPVDVPFSENMDLLAKEKPQTFTACDTARDDVALIAFTSGTTGVPKGTMHFHADVLAMCDLFPRHVLKPVASDVFCGTPPLAFTFGLGGMLAFPLRAGAATLLIEGLTPEKLLLAIGKHKASICFTAPTFYRQMAILLDATPEKYDISSLKKCVSAGEALPTATRALWQAATGLALIDGIGATEMIHIFIASAGADIKPGAIGKVVPGYEAKIVDDSLRELARGQIGKLAVRGPTGCRYLADDRQKNYVKNGWNLTGDTFVQDDEGYFVYQARSDDMIISAGYNIAGPEVEAALLQHPSVAECGVVGLPDEERGQIVKAFVVLKADEPASEKTVATLQAFVKQAIAPYKYPRAIEFVAALPRTETGKLQRFKLKTMSALK